MTKRLIFVPALRAIFSCVSILRLASLRVNLGVELAYYSRDSVSVTLIGTDECS